MPEQFTIDTREKADWFLKTLLSYDAEEAKLKAEAATILAQLDAMITRNKADKDSFQGRFHQQFERFVAEQIAADRRRLLALSSYSSVGWPQRRIR
jgi:peptide methionine sulfoxide reductase MsrB